MNNESAPLVLKNVKFKYYNQEVLSNINLVMEWGDFLGLVGPNGGGKTTLLKLILGLLRPTSGEIKVFGKNPVQARKQVGYVPQVPSFQPDFPIRVKDVVIMGRLGSETKLGMYRTEDKTIVEDTMRKVDIYDLGDNLLNTLSGGQRQRVLIARALVKNPRLLLLDEPTTSVDSKVEQDFYELLKLLNKDMTIILVNHDLGFISRYINKVACINRVMVCHRTGEITIQDIQKIYGSPMEMLDHRCDI